MVNKATRASDPLSLTRLIIFEVLISLVLGYFILALIFFSVLTAAFLLSSICIFVLLGFCALYVEYLHFLLLQRKWSVPVQNEHAIEKKCKRRRSGLKYRGSFHLTLAKFYVHLCFVDEEISDGLFSSPEHKVQEAHTNTSLP